MPLAYMSQVSSFPAEEDRTLPPRATSAPILVSFHTDAFYAAPRPALPAAVLAVHTNVSVFRIPLHAYHGGLTVAAAEPAAPAHETQTQERDAAAWTLSPVPAPRAAGAGRASLSRRPPISGGAERSISGAAAPAPVSEGHRAGVAQTSWVMDLGLLRAGARRVYTLNVSNANPVTLGVKVSQRAAAGKGGVASKSWSLEVSGAAAKGKTKTQKGAPTVEIPPWQAVSVQVHVRSLAEEAVDDVLVLESEFETAEIRVRYTSLEGELVLQRRHVPLPAAFPGKTVGDAVYATSTYSQPIRVTGMRSSDVRIRASVAGEGDGQGGAAGVVLQPGVLTLLGRVTFDPARGPAHHNYMAASVWTPEDQALTLTRQKLESDGVLPLSHLAAMAKLDGVWDALSGARNVTATITIESSPATGVNLSVSGLLERPDVLAEGRELVFPLTQLGRASEQHLAIQNPSDAPMLAQLLFSPLPLNLSDRARAQAQFLCPRAHSLEGVVVPPRSQGHLGPVFFKPNATGVHVATAYVRTNLSLLSPVRLRGEGGSGRLDLVDADDDGSHLACNALRFEVGVGNGSLTASGIAPGHKDVTLRNAGSLPIQVYGLGFDGEACQMNGLTVRECSLTEAPLHLAPGANRSVTLSFAPDCTVASKRVDLVARTNVGTFKRSLFVSVGLSQLEACYRSRTRAGLGGVLQGSRHGWTCLALTAFLVCLSPSSPFLVVGATVAVSCVTGDYSDVFTSLRWWQTF